MKPTTLQIDPDVKIPAAVLAQAARSQALFEATQAAPTEDGEVTPQGNPELDASTLLSADPAPEETIEQPAAQPAPAPATPAPSPPEYPDAARRGAVAAVANSEAKASARS